MGAETKNEFEDHQVKEGWSEAGIHMVPTSIEI